MGKIRLNDGDEAILTINGKDVTVSKLTVSPSSAEEIISRSDAIFTNRKSREASYMLYSEDMDRGEWKTNGETIKFGTNGELLDGRNRLNAVYKSKSGKNIDFIAIGNLDRNVVDTIDIGMKRTLEHVLKMQGYAYETGAATIVKMKLGFDTRKKGQPFSGSESTMGISRLDEVHEYEKNSDRYNDASIYGQDVYSVSHKALNRSEVGAIYMHLTETLQWDKEIVREFFNKLATPVRKTIFFTTYDKLNNKKVCRGKDRLIQYIICWNSYITGKKSQRTSYNDGDWFISPNEMK